MPCFFLLLCPHPPAWSFRQQEPNPYNVPPNTVYYVLTAENAG